MIIDILSFGRLNIEIINIAADTPVPGTFPMTIPDKIAVKMIKANVEKFI